MLNIARTTKSQIVAVFVATNIVAFLSASANAKQPFDAYVAATADDASLNSVFAASPDRVWAVGDRGMIWATADGGRNWAKQESGTTANLYAVTFKNTLEGCAVGGLPGALSRMSRGVILRTVDGGETWSAVPNDGLPRFTGMRIVGNQLIAWGDYCPRQGSGIFFSLDDGRSWQAMPSSIVHVSALGAEPSGSVLAVDRVGNAFNSQLGPTRTSFATQPNQPIAFVESVGTTWIAGGADGQLLRTVDGQSWNRIKLPLSAEAQKTCVWKSAFQIENEIWIVGSPGSIVLHSADQGITWQLLSTEQTLPLRSVAFADSLRGWSVGPLGLILATRDGGRSWYPQKRTASRLGLLTVTATDAQVPWPSLIAASWDDSVASGSVSLFVDSPEQSADYRVEKWVFNESIAPQLGLVEHRAWLQSRPAPTVPVDLVGLTERLAVELQCWRPDVVLSNEIGDGRVAPANRATLVAITNAIQKAKTSLPQSVSAELQLPAWQVTKLATVTETRSGQYSEHPNRLLREPGLSIWDVLMPTGAGFNANAEAISMRTVQQEQHTLASTASLFGGVAINPASRRQVTARSLGNYQLIMGRVHRMASLDNLVTLPPQTPITEWQQQLDFVARALPPRELAPSLLRIANGCAAPNQWQRRQIALERLLQLQSESDAASSARLMLLQMLSSDEMRAWKRAVENESASNLGLGGLAYTSVASAVATPTAASPFESARNNGAVNNAATNPDGSQVVSASFVSTPGNELRTNEAAGLLPKNARDEKLDEAFFVALDNCYKADPLLVKLPELELLRESMQRARSEAIRTAPVTTSTFESIMQHSALAGWPQVARQELLLAHGRPEQLRWIAFAVATKERPRLDGVLDESMWSTCPPMQLVAGAKQRLAPESVADVSQLSNPSGQPQSETARVFWSYDDRYLYIGIDAPQAASFTQGPPPKLRKYDNNLSSTDHLHFTLDTDRDYSSAIELGVSATGETFDRCCELPSYNPKYAVAVPSAPVAGRWTAEIAIRIEDLTTHSSLSGRAWAVAAHRRNPVGESESWSTMITEQAALQSAGLLLFVPAPQ